MLYHLPIANLDTIHNRFFYINSMRKILFLDTETTGLPKINDDGTIPHYTNIEAFQECRMLQLSAILSNENGHLITKMDKYIDLNPFFNDAISINLITEEMIQTMGVAILKVLKYLEQLVIQADEIVIQNANFDKNVILSEVERIRVNSGVDMMPVFGFHFQRTFCTKKFFRIVFDVAETKYRSKHGPSLNEIFCNVMKTDKLPPNRPDSMVDTMMLYDIYFKAKLNERS